MDEKDNLGK